MATTAGSGIRFVTEFVEAVRDGNLSGDEVTQLLKRLAEMVPGDKILDEAGEILADALYKDSVELRERARRLRKRAGDLERDPRGKQADKAKGLREEAVELDRLADKREGTPRDVEQAARSKRQTSRKRKTPPPAEESVAEGE